MNDILDDLGEYRARVELARLEQSGETIHNSSHRHAAVLIEQLFLAARHRVRVVCRTLNREAWATPAVVLAAKQFSRREDARLDIIVEDDSQLTPGSHAFLMDLAALPNVKVLKADGVMPRMDFLVADEAAYRLERNPAEPIARASFNRRDIGEALVRIFDITAPTCKPVTFREAAA